MGREGGGGVSYELKTTSVKVVLFLFDRGGWAIFGKIFDYYGNDC